MNRVSCILFLIVVLNGVLAQTNYKKKVYTTKDGLVSDFVYDIAKDSLGKLWIATDEGISIFNGESFDNRNIDNSGLVTNYIKNILLIDSLLYVSYSNKEQSLHIANKELSICEKGNYETINIKNNSELGSYLIPDSQKEGILKILNLTQKEVNIWYKDREKSYWLGTKGSGIIHIEEDGGYLIDQSYQGGGIFKLGEECIYVNEGFFFSLKNKTKRPLNKYIDDVILNVHLFAKDTLIVGEKGVYDWSTLDIIVPFKNATASIKYEDTLVIGTINQGVFYVAGDTVIKNYDLSDGLAHSKVNNLYYFDNTLWVATASGISKIKEEKIETLVDSEYYDWRKFIEIRGRLYAFTLQSGAYRIGNRKCSLTLDYENQVFEGAYKYADNSIIVFSNGIYHWSIRSIKNVGITYPLDSKPLCVCGNSLLYVSDSQLATVSLLEKENRPNFEIASLKINGKVILDNFVEQYLPHGKYDIEIELAPIYLNIGEKVIYSYRVNGRQWAPYSESRTILLPEVSNSFGIEIKATIKGKEYLVSEYQNIMFNVDIPFWRKTKTIYFLMGIIIISIVLFFSIKNAAVRRRNRELAHLVKEKTKEIEKDKKVILEKNKELMVLSKAIEDTSNPLAVFNDSYNIIYSNQEYEKLFRASTKLSIIDFFEIEQKTLDKLSVEISNTFERRLKVNIKDEYFLITVTRVVETGIYILVAQNISERKEIEESLRLSKDNAIKSQKAKEIMLSSINHEIRNPINAIVGTAQLLSEEALLNQKQKELTNMLKDSASSLLSLVNNGLFLGKQEAGMLMFEKSPFSINKVVESVCSILGYQARIKNVDIEISNLLENDYCIGDSTRLKQVLLNLIGNAIKFTNNGKVLIEIREEEAIVFSIKDNGIGIKSEHLPFLFKRYTQFEEGHSASKEGTGLGMFICKTIVEEQGGSIKARSKYQKGTTVIFTLPYPLIDKDNIVESKEPTPLENKRVLSILIVEDDIFNQLYLKQLLGRYKHTVKICTSIQKAISAINERIYDVILTDVQLPDGNGIDLAKQIKTNSENQKTPIVVLTAYSKEKVIQGIDANLFQDYIQKPFSPSLLIERIYNVVTTNKKRQPHLINQDRVYNILGEDKHLFSLLATSFCSQYPKALEEIAFFTGELDEKNYKRKIHTLKSTMGYFALESQIKLLDDILEQIKHKNKEKAKEILFIFEKEMTSVMCEMKKMVVSGE